MSINPRGHELNQTAPPHVGVTRADVARLQAVMSGGFAKFMVRRKISVGSGLVNELIEEVPEELTGSPFVSACRGNDYESTLITPAEGLRLNRPWLRRPAELEHQIGTVLERLPRSIGGSLGRAAIFGDKSDKRHDFKFVALTLDEDISDVLSDEREQLLDVIGKSCKLQENWVPHLTLFKTKDPRVAKKLRLHLNRARTDRLRDGGLPIKLQKPDFVKYSR